VKRLIFVLLTLPLSWSLGEPLFAETTYQPGYSTSTQCFRDEYQEEYVPGTKDKPGHVRNWTEKVEIPCRSKLSARKPKAAKYASKEAFLVDFSVLLPELLYHGEWTLDWRTCWWSSRSNDWLPSRRRLKPG
jgi:hypothetical protein